MTEKIRFTKNLINQNFKFLLCENPYEEEKKSNNRLGENICKLHIR